MFRKLASESRDGRKSCSAKSVAAPHPNEELSVAVTAAVGEASAHTSANQPQLAPTAPEPLPYVIWVCAAHKEYAQAKVVIERHFDLRLERCYTPRSWPYAFGVCTFPDEAGDGQKFEIFVVLTNDQGGAAMTDTIDHMVSYCRDRHRPPLQPKAVVSSGFCAGNKNKVQLGDICVAHKSFDLRSGGKTEDGDVIPGTSRTEIVTNNATSSVEWFGRWDPMLVEMSTKTWGDRDRLVGGIVPPARKDAEGNTLNAWTPKARLVLVFLCGLLML